MGNNLAMKLCPCGNLGDPTRQCTCTAVQVQRYESRISGPLQDRIDLHLEVPAVPYKDLADSQAGEPSSDIRARVVAARCLQEARFSGRKKIYCNAQMGPRDIKQFCKLDQDSENLLEKAMQRLRLSARAYHRIIKIARTIADLENHDLIKKNHIAEAVQYRRQEPTSR